MKAKRAPRYDNIRRIMTQLAVRARDSSHAILVRLPCESRATSMRVSCDFHASLVRLSYDSHETLFVYIDRDIYDSSYDSHETLKRSELCKGAKFTRSHGNRMRLSQESHETLLDILYCRETRSNEQKRVNERHNTLMAISNE